MSPKRKWLSRNFPALLAISTLASLALVVWMVRFGPLREPFAGWFAAWYGARFGPCCSSENANVYAGAPSVKAAPPPTTWGAHAGSSPVADQAGTGEGHTDDAGEATPASAN